MNYDSKINNYNANEVNEIGVNTMKVETIQTGWTYFFNRCRME